MWNCYDENYVIKAGTCSKSQQKSENVLLALDWTVRQIGVILDTFTIQIALKFRRDYVIIATVILLTHDK